jgi:acetyl esterase
MALEAVATAASSVQPPDAAAEEALDVRFAALMRLLPLLGALPAPSAAVEQWRARGMARGPAQPCECVAELQLPGADAGCAPLRARVYRPAGAGTAARPPLIIWLHGGGWVSGTLEGYDCVCRALANASRAVVLSLEYRLAPEARFPAALRDVRAALRWAAAASDAPPLLCDARRVALAGDSAGGNLAAAAALQLQQEHAAGDSPMRAVVLVYPVLDAAMDTRSYAAFATGHGLTRVAMAAFWAHYLGDGDAAAALRRDWRAAPLCAPQAVLAAQPRTLVLTAACDVLRDEGEAYAAALTAAGVDCQLMRVRGAYHGFLETGHATCTMRARLRCCRLRRCCERRWVWTRSRRRWAHACSCDRRCGARACARAARR